MNVDDLIPGREPSGLTRAELLRRSAFAAGVVTTGGLLAACSGGGGGGTAAASVPSADRAPLATTWQVSNWPHFIDTDSDGTHPTLTAFDSRYDTDTVYSEDIASNEAAAAKYAPMLAEGEDIGQDAIVLSDWMAYQWIHAGYAQRLDPVLLPHVTSLRIPPLRKRPIDPDDEFLIPWQAGLTGVIYDPAKTNGELSRVNDLFDPLFPGKITLLDNMRDTLGLVLMAMHVPPESASPEAAQAAADKIRTELVEPGKVLRFAGGDYVDDLVQGKVAAAFGWSTDYERLVEAKPDLLFMIPNEGSLIWSDDILIPLAAQHPQNAHRFADYYYTPSTAAELTRAVRYTTPLAGTKSALTRAHPTDPLLTDDATSPMQRVAQLIFLQGRALELAHRFRGLTPDQESEFTTIFESAKG
jgi:spermidine/putrescine transport system substrate-binding protein